IIASTLITASSVSICGMIGWIGLVIPHLARAVAGPNYQGLLPVCTAFGACFLLLVDVTARCAWSVELPIGVLTALLGAPFFLLIFKSNTRGWK
ncbi:MAG: iron chelate uptake ABC transporter family permease subunit, partial [Clostridiales bacterium]